MTKSRFADEFKEEAVKQVIERGYAVSNVAKPGVLKWTITRRDPVILNVELNRIAKRSAERILENGPSLRWCYTGTEAKTCNLR